MKIEKLKQSSETYCFDSLRDNESDDRYRKAIILIALSTMSVICHAIARKKTLMKKDFLISLFHRLLIFVVAVVHIDSALQDATTHSLMTCVHFFKEIDSILASTGVRPVTIPNQSYHCKLKNTFVHIAHN